MRDICFVILKFIYEFIFLHRILNFFRIKYNILRSIWVSVPFKSAKNVSFGKIGSINCPQFISIGEKTSFGDYLYLTAWNSYLTVSDRVVHDGEIIKDKINDVFVQHLNPCLTIGSNCNFGAFNHITCTNSIKIGNNVLTGKWVTITDNSHGGVDKDSLCIHPIQRPIVSKGEVYIDDDVWIGDKATILPGVKIGKSAIIAANSVVTKDVPPFCVVGGNPAVILKQHSNY